MFDVLASLCEAWKEKCTTNIIKIGRLNNIGLFIKNEELISMKYIIPHSCIFNRQASIISIKFILYLICSIILTYSLYFHFL